MTPPVKWFLDQEEDSVVLYTTAPGTATSPATVDKLGIVRDIMIGLAKGKPVLKVSYERSCSFLLVSF